MSFIHRFNNYLLKLVLKLDYNRRSTNYFLIRRKKEEPQRTQAKTELGVYFSTLPSACETIDGLLSNWDAPGCPREVSKKMIIKQMFLKHIKCIIKL